MADELKPWDRQPDETEPAYEAFQIYLNLDLKDRRLKKVIEVIGNSGASVRKWSAQFNWRNRAAAWDSIPLRVIAETHEQTARRIAEQHDRIATKLLNRLEANLDALPTGADPTIRWSTAHGSARQGHIFAVELSKPRDSKHDEINKAIENLLNKLAGED